VEQSVELAMNLEYYGYKLILVLLFNLCYTRLRAYIKGVTSVKNN